MELTLVMAATTLLLVVLGFLSLNDEPRVSSARAERPGPLPEEGAGMPLGVRRG
ncbi:hypothetical protein [Deinococcus sp. NW-56]|uniref:hypothetical protein n=1 Tax=Deinococcus sp. NW-56 TaxID=2080419 RepID=UPI00131A221F|nr:hypothetical protein [Deinococcus sp. NW-56]